MVICPGDAKPRAGWIVANNNAVKHQWSTLIQQKIKPYICRVTQTKELPAKEIDVVACQTSINTLFGNPHLVFYQA